MVGTEVCRGGARLYVSCPAGEGWQGRGRTDATRRAQTAFLASPRSPPSLLCSHLWLPSRSLTADLAVKWAGEIVGGGTNSWLALLGPQLFSYIWRPQSFDL